MRGRSRQRGVALIVALLVVALAVILVAALLDRGELAMARTRNALRAEQAEAYALGIESFATRVLLKAQADEPGLDSAASAWALPLPPQEVPGGLIAGRLADRNGCFNLNNLSPENPTHAAWAGMFRDLLTHLGTDPALAVAIQDWLGAGDAGPVTNRYLAQPVPYRPRRDLFAHESELRLVLGVSAQAYERLAPHVCALPPGTRLNLNTADVDLLWSLSGLGVTMTRPQAEKLWSGGRARHGDVASFAAEAGIPAALLPATMFAVRSDYFLLRADVVLDDLPLTFRSLLERGNGSVRVLWRRRGADDAAAVDGAAATREP